ncbi:MAG TPA: ATP-binding protein [Xanthomonadales bacterium]|nr:ATP-binding protein [Xanthomonadales bacterium]
MWQWLKRLFSRRSAAPEAQPQVWNFRIKGGRAEIGAVNDALERAAMAGEVPELAMRAMQVALDELLTNAIMHGKVTLNDPMQVDLIVAKSALRAVISHAGPAFDPTEVAAPDLEGSLPDREIGGLGIHLVRSMMDEFSYEHIDGRNILKLGKNFR